MNSIPRLILVSKSPRRRALLKQAGLRFRAVSADTDETADPRLSPALNAIRIAEKKARAVEKKHPHDLLVSADTIVVLGNKIFGKPGSAADAFRMLKCLSGKTHEVITGVALLGPLRNGTRKAVRFFESTKVFFDPVPDQAARYYIRHYKPFDKAGAYAIQEWIGTRYINKITGDYNNVMGFPVKRIINIIHKIFPDTGQTI